MIPLIILGYPLMFALGFKSSHYLRRKESHPMIERVGSPFWEWVKRHVVAIALTGFIIGALGVPAAIIFSNHQAHATIEKLHDQAACQDAYAQKLVTILKARADAGQEAVLAPEQFIDEILHALQAKNPTDAEREQNLKAVTDAAQAAHDAYHDYRVSQTLHPLPPLPEQYCAEGGGGGQ